jgi:hypothetical protein
MDVQDALARIESILGAHGEAISTIKTEVDDVRASQRRIEIAFATGEGRKAGAKGVWAAFAAVGTLFASIGAAIAKLLLGNGHGGHSP